MTPMPTPTEADTSYDPRTATPTYGTGAGPLTTVFQTPDFCASSLWQYPLTPPLYSSICMPPNFNNYWNWQIGYYSPGICPSGYTAACDFPTSLATFSSFTDESASSKSWPYYGGEVKSDETARLCCPTGYNCYSTGMMGVGWSYSLCISTVPSTTMRDPEVTTGTAYTTTENLAYAIQVRWREEDLSILETNPTVPGQTIVQTQAITDEATPQATQATQAGTDSTDAPGTFSRGSVAVAAGVSVGVFLLLLLSAILIWRLAKKRKQVARLQMSEKDNKSPKVGSSADTVSTTLSSGPYSPNPVSPLTDAGARSITGTVKGANTAEIDSSPVAEMATGESNAAELAGDATKPVELATEEKPVEVETRDFVAELPGDMPASWREDVDGRPTRMNTRKQPGEKWNWI
ncbi:hypothetical protein INS49_014956 [Diaporthe citri]|uniref:uncharacterized protein n=1 Tax=Diaporthe citri TaxID=83186 RepID=UPI001C81E2A2|nr:uncharacterized protein INS49_014956 [Diaporthe citri]KAG6357079.1 hypothetical protein INS49_014956 [Diaporthe citri]